MMKNIKFPIIFQYLIFFLFLAISGGQFFYMLYGRYFVPLFLIISILYHHRKHKGFYFNDSFYFLVLGGFYLLIHYFFIYPDHVGNTFLPQILLFIGSYFFISSFSFPRFKELYLNTIVFMGVISIILFLLVENGLVSPTTIIKNQHVHQMFMLHNFGWSRTGTFGRMAGIYWEPGAYQIVLNMTFFLYFRELISNKMTKAQIIKLLIVSIAVLMTQSTAGYMMIALLALYCGVRYFIRNNITIKSLTLLIALVIALPFLYNSIIIQDKLAQKDRAGSSYEIRRSDNVAMIKMIQEQPLLGYGIDSKEKKARSLTLDNHTNSNGMLSILSTLGFLFFIIYAMFLFRGLYRIYSIRDGVIVFLLFMFLNAFEVFWYFPVAYIFHFQMISNRTTLSSIIKNKL